jgi:hypothetical protein
VTWHAHAPTAGDFYYSCSNQNAPAFIAPNLRCRPRRCRGNGRCCYMSFLADKCDMSARARQRNPPGSSLKCALQHSRPARLALSAPHSPLATPTIAARDGNDTTGSLGRGLDGLGRSAASLASGVTCTTQHAHTQTHEIFAILTTKATGFSKMTTIHRASLK